MHKMAPQLPPALMPISVAVTEIIARLSEPLQDEPFDEIWVERWSGLSKNVSALNLLAQAGLALIGLEDRARS